MKTNSITGKKNRESKSLDTLESRWISSIDEMNEKFISKQSRETESENNLFITPESIGKYRYELSLLKKKESEVKLVYYMENLSYLDYDKTKLINFKVTDESFFSIKYAATNQVNISNPLFRFNLQDQSYEIRTMKVVKALIPNATEDNIRDFHFSILDQFLGLKYLDIEGIKIAIKKTISIPQDLMN